jgi:hypothetical protein
MKPLKRIVALLSGLVVVPALVTPILAQSAGPNAAFSTGSSMQKVKTVFVIMMENKNWTGNNTGASFGDPDLKDNPLAPYINGDLFNTSAHPQQYYNPPGNHPEVLSREDLCDLRSGYSSLIPSRRYPSM